MGDTETRECKTCHAILPITQFHKGKGYAGGRHPNCRACRGVKHPDWSAIRLENESLAASNRRRCIKCKAIKPLGKFSMYEKSSDGYRQECDECGYVRCRPIWREARRRLRLEAIARYGGRCFCCGEGRHEFMAIDHTNGGGSKERKAKLYRPGNGFIVWLKKNGWPTGFRIACHNCNSALGSHGYCPHSSKASSFDELYAERAEDVERGKLLAAGRKRCSICKAAKLVGDFIASARSDDGLRGVCKPCEKTSDGVRRDAGAHGWTDEMRVVAARKHNRKRRLEALDRYGTSCACCGENHPEFLQTDHVDGGGTKHRASTGAANLLWWLKSKGWPDGYRTLCANCNLSLGFYGYCPHKGTGGRVRDKMQVSKEV